MKIKPLKNYLLVKQELKDNATKSGIIMTGGDKEDTFVAQVKETSDYYEDEQEILLKGDKILMKAHSGTRVRLEEEELIIINQKDVLAVIKY